jgi:VanZ family protein
MPSADRVATATAAAAVGLQLAVLYAPRTPAVATGGLPVDKVIHVGVFLLPTVALVRAGVARRWAIGLMAAHAPASELLQHAMLPGRSGEPMDVVADLVGVALGAWLVRPGGAWAVEPATPSP